MNLWQTVQSLSVESQTQVIKLYEEAKIPIDLRHLLAPWVEVQIRELEPLPFLQGLQQQINTLPFFVRERLTEFQNALSQEYISNPESLQIKILDCLMKEYELIKKEQQRISLSPIITETSQNNGSTTTTDHSANHLNATETDPAKRILMLKLRSNEIDEMLRQLDDYQKDFVICLDKNQQIKGMLRYREAQNGPHGLDQSPEVENMIRKSEDIHTNIKTIAHWIFNLHTQLELNLSQVVEHLSSLQRISLQKAIHQWRYEQQRSFAGYPITLDISVIQRMSEDIAEVLYKTLKQLHRANQIKSSVTILSYEKKAEIFQPLLERASCLLRELAQMTFLIEHQPLPIIRTETKFYVPVGKKPLTVGSLIADKLNPRMDPPPVVTINMINAKTAEKIFHHGLTDLTSAEVVGVLSDNVCQMEYSHPERPHLAAVFRHIRLMRLRESRKRGNTNSEQATDEKLYLLCTTKFSVANMEFQVWTLSLPFVVTTHVNQDCKSTLTILWHYGLASIDRTPFDVPDRCSWTAILELLNVYFCNLIGVPLTHIQRQYLTFKATKSTGQLIETLEELKEHMEDRRFSFWDWFYNCTKLTEKHFKNEWRSGYVIGFIGKDKAEELLATSQPWTFTLRFSEFTLGAISIICRMDGDDGEACSLRPFDSKELDIRSLADKINDLVQLMYIYPDKPKAEIFGDAKIESQATHQEKKHAYINLFTVVIGMSWRTTFEKKTTLPDISDIIMDLDEYIDNLDVPQFDEDEFNRHLGTLRLETEGN